MTELTDRAFDIAEWHLKSALDYLKGLCGCGHIKGDHFVPPYASTSTISEGADLAWCAECEGFCVSIGIWEPLVVP